MRRGTIVAIAAMLLVVTSLGCGADPALVEPQFTDVSVDADAWGSINEGMSLDDVKEALGEPSHSMDTGGSGSLFYETADSSYTVNLQDGVVTNKTKNPRPKTE